MSDPKADIRTLYGRVTRHFSDLDLAAFRGCFHLPCLLTTADGVHLVSNEEEFETLFGMLIGNLTEQGFTRSAIERQQIRVLNDNTALTSVLWVRYRGDEVLERLGATYTLTRVEGNWRIAALVAHGEDDVLALG